ncbi:MAG: hypothetical protein AAGI28_03800 [Pseudomonadota bacterium]
MTKLHKLPLALAALGASTPALAHENGLFHIHNEGAVLASAAAIAIAGVAAWKFLANRSRK